MRKTWLGGLGLVIAVAAAVVPAQAAPPAPMPANLAPNRVLKAVVNSDLKILDPTWTTTYITIRYGYLVYDTLFALNAKLEPKPQMVESYTISPDAMSYSFTLRPGQKWSDGTPVTAADCVASLNRWAKRNAMGQHLVASMDGGFQVKDDLTFSLKLKQPFGLVLDALAGAEAPAFMMPARIANGPVDQQVTDPTGSGPFIFRKDIWQPGNKATFDRNPDYIPRKEPPDYLAGGKVAKVDRVEWLYMPDNNTALAALQAGEIDYFESPPLDFISLMKSSDDLTVLTIDTLGVQMLGRPNTLYPPFNNYKAREALLYLNNQSDSMQAVVGDPTLFLPNCPAYFMCGSDNESKAGAEPIHQDFAKAKALFAEAGYKGEPVVVLQATDRPQYAAATTVLIDELRKAGVNVDIQSLDWATISSRRASKTPPDKGGWNLFVTSQGGPDVASPMANIWFNSACGAGNVGWPCDKDLVDLVGAWAKEADPAKRHALIDGIQARAYVSVPYVNLGQYVQPIAFRANVKGVLAAGVPVYWNIEKK
jgi:peptide/nickel transport system substrate-binding protein